MPKATRKKKLVKAVRKARKAHGGQKLLSAEQRARLLKPPENAEEVADQAANLLEAAGRRVPAKVRPSQLRRLAAVARKAQDKEQQFEARIAEKLAALQDARLKAYDALWRAVLDVNAAAYYAERDDEGLKKLFAPLHASIPGGRPSGGGSDAPEEASAPSSPEGDVA